MLSDGGQRNFRPSQPANERRILVRKVPPFLQGKRIGILADHTSRLPVFLQAFQCPNAEAIQNSALLIVSRSLRVVSDIKRIPIKTDRRRNRLCPDRFNIPRRWATCESRRSKAVPSPEIGRGSFIQEVGTDSNDKSNTILLLHVRPKFADRQHLPSAYQSARADNHAQSLLFEVASLHRFSNWSSDRTVAMSLLAISAPARSLAVLVAEFHRIILPG